MNVSLYRDRLWVFKSGIDTAYRHQRQALTKVGVRVLEYLSPDSRIVHFNWYSPMSRARMKRAKSHGQKAVVFAHSANDLRGSFKGSDFCEPVLRRYLASFYSKADLLITPTEYGKSLITGKGYEVEKPVHVISNGVDTERFVFSEETRQAYRRQFRLEKPTVVTAGQFIPRKGVIDFIETARLLPEFDFLWFGPIMNRQFSFSSQMKKSLKNKPANLTIAGFVPRIEDALCCGDIFFFPSFEEMEGIALLEAACIGLPIVLRPIPVYQNWLIPETNCLAGANPEEFANQIKRLWGDQQLRQSLAANAHEMALSRNLHSIGEQLLGAYRSELDIAFESRQTFNTILGDELNAL